MLKERVRFDTNRITSNSWSEYPILRFSEVPEVDVEVISRPEIEPVGAGEAAHGPVTAAIANAVFDALGVRISRPADHARPPDRGNGTLLMSALNILSGGAAQGLVGSLAGKFKELTGLPITGEFGAVGAMATKLREGAPADILVLTAALIADLVREGRVDGASIADVGRVETALAVRERDATVSVHDATSLREALLEQMRSSCPTSRRPPPASISQKSSSNSASREEVAERLRIYPNGATAMRHMAESDARTRRSAHTSDRDLATKGVKLSGALPKGCDLATVYTAAMTTKAAHAREAQVLIDLLTAADQRALRERAGFLAT